MRIYVVICVFMMLIFESGSFDSTLIKIQFDTREVFQLFGHHFLGCGSYDLEIWQDVSPLPSYTY